MLTQEQKDAIDAQINSPEISLTDDEKEQIYANVQKMINSTYSKITIWFDEAKTDFVNEATKFVKGIENTITAADFTNPNNKAVLYAKDKEPVWIYLKKIYEEWEKNGGEVKPKNPPDPSPDFCLSNFAQVAAGLALPIGGNFLSSLKSALCAPDGGLVDAIDSVFPGFKTGYQDVDKFRKEKLNDALKLIADAKKSRTDFFKDLTVWKNWDSLLTDKLNKLKKTAKDEVSKFVQDQLHLTDDSGLTVEQLAEKAAQEKQIGNALAIISVNGLERCYNNNPMFKDFKKVMEDTKDVIKIYTDNVYEKISGVNSKIAEYEFALTSVLTDVRDYDPCTLAQDVVGKGQDCYSCFSNYIKWKTDDTGKMKQPVCSIDWCAAIDLNGNKVADWLNTPIKGK